jgi:MinD-like ATPase involved in chromosome partitioning or flagellar assembly
VIHSLVSRKPVVKFRPHCDASVGFMKLAAALSGEEYDEPKSRKFLGVYDKLRATIFPNKTRLSELVEESFH